MERVAIIGGPCTGKTTLCTELFKRGRIVVPESARAIIAEQSPNGILPWTDLYGFQILVAQRQLALEERVKGDAFFDRGIIDNIAYCTLGGIDVPQIITDALQTRRYTRVFALDRLPYETDGERIESAEEGERIHSTMIDTYRRYGYEPESVPVLGTPAQRADYILDMMR